MDTENFENLFNILNIKIAEEGMILYTWYESLNNDERQFAMDTANSLSDVGQLVSTLIIMHRNYRDRFPDLDKSVIMDMSERWLAKMQ